MSASLVLPGEDIVDEEGSVGGGFLRGHGTYVEGGRLVSALVGVVERVNRLVTVRPLQARYSGEVGDVVVGRIRDVQSKRWHVDISGRQDAVLLLSSINLSDGVQRRRTEQDQLNMRSFFSEDDLISAEVRAVQSNDGTLSLHARNLKYGKLENGVVVRVPCCLMRRLKQHFCTLPCGVDVILGLNGHIWLTASMEGYERGSEEEGLGGAGGEEVLLGEEGGMIGSSGALTLDPQQAADAGLAEAIERRKRIAAERDITPEARLRVSRARNCVLALAQAGLTILPDAISSVFFSSETLGLTPDQIVDPKHTKAVCQAAREAAQARGSP